MVLIENPITIDQSVVAHEEAIQQSYIDIWRPEDAEYIYDHLESRNWAPWLATPPDILAYYARLFPEGQLMVRGASGNPLATLTMNRINWDGDIASLPSWDEVAGANVSNGDYATTYTPDGNALIMMSMNVDPDFQKQGYASQLSAAAKDQAKQLGATYLLSPFRPTEFGKYKAETGLSDDAFGEYCAMVRELDGLPIDSWLRSLTRNGMCQLKVQEVSMQVSLPLGEFDTYRDTNFKGAYHPERWYQQGDTWECREVGSWEVIGDQAVYTEKNLWGMIPLE